MSGRSDLLVAVEARLLVEVAVAEHARQLDHLAQLHLSPLPARVRLAQGRDQCAGLSAAALLGLDSVLICVSSCAPVLSRSRLSDSSCCCSGLTSCSTAC